MTGQATDNHLKSFYDKCHHIGLSVTPQRLAIYKALVGNANHPSPEMIFNQVRTDFPMISFATVYKTLETFEHKGIISKVTTLHNTLRYDPMTRRHHHVICTQCEKIIDITDADLDSLHIPDQVIKDNILVDFSVHFNVVCAECRRTR